LLLYIATGFHKIYERQDNWDYMRYTNKPITDISFESGFENNTHLSHLFKKRFGASLLTYRKEESSSKVS